MPESCWKRHFSFIGEAVSLETCLSITMETSLTVPFLSFWMLCWSFQLPVLLHLPPCTSAHSSSLTVDKEKQQPTDRKRRALFSLSARVACPTFWTFTKSKCLLSQFNVKNTFIGNQQWLFPYLHGFLEERNLFLLNLLHDAFKLKAAKWKLKHVSSCNCWHTMLEPKISVLSEIETWIIKLNTSLFVYNSRVVKQHKFPNTFFLCSFWCSLNVSIFFTSSFNISESWMWKLPMLSISVAKNNQNSNCFNIWPQRR